MLGIDLKSVLQDVLPLWKAALPAIFAGCLLGCVLKDTCFGKILSRLMFPLARLGRLSRDCATFLALCLVSYDAGKSMLASMKREGIVDERELLYSYLISSLPAGMSFLLFYIAPAIFSSLGWKPAVAYLALYMLTNMIISGVGLAMGRRSLPAERAGLWLDGHRRNNHAGRMKITGAKLKNDLMLAAKQFFSMAGVFIPVTLLSACILKTPAAAAVLDSVGPLLSCAGLPPSSVVAIAAGVPSMVAGIGALGPIVREGLLTGREAISTLLITSMLHSIYEFCFRTLPANMAFFGAPGFRATVVSLAVRLLTSVFFLAAVLPHK
ncbi:MAG: hypothetical protein K6T66_12780 [Peptococcaceae bacterium]|nr:hypothetical protein [Peptococcaceae bacterium]